MGVQPSRLTSSRNTASAPPLPSNFRIRSSFVCTTCVHAARRDVGVVDKKQKTRCFQGCWAQVGAVVSGMRGVFRRRHPVFILEALPFDALAAGLVRLILQGSLRDSGPLHQPGHRTGQMPMHYQALPAPQLLCCPTAAPAADCRPKSTHKPHVPQCSVTRLMLGLVISLPR